MKRQMYQVSSFYNEHEDQGMRECVCGVTLEKGDFLEAMENVMNQIDGFSSDFTLKEGSFKVSIEKDTMFITWTHSSDDRCFGFEITSI